MRSIGWSGFGVLLLCISACGDDGASDSDAGRDGGAGDASADSPGPIDGGGDAAVPCTDDSMCDDENPCTEDTCGAAGTCQNTSLAGTCDDGDPCTDRDMCMDGVCTGLTLTCDDNDPCTADSCDAMGACLHTPSGGTVQLTSVGRVASHARAGVQGLEVVGDTLYAASSLGLEIYDISGANPSPLGGAGFGLGNGRIDVVGSTAYAGSTDGLRILDVTDPAAPEVLGRIDSGRSPGGVRVAGTYAYMSFASVFEVHDVSDPSSPTLVGTTGISGPTTDVWVDGTTVYVALGGNGVAIVDVSTPATPSVIGSISTTNARAVRVAGSVVYVADGASGFRIFDVSTLATPMELGSVDTSSAGDANGLALDGGVAYVLTPSTLFTIDVSTPGSPVDSTTFSSPSGGLRGLDVSGTTAYLGGDVLRVVDVSDPMSGAETGSYGADGSSRAVAVVGDVAYVADGPAGLRIFDVSDPAAIAEVAGSGAIGTDAIEIQVSGGRGYMGDRVEGLVVLDLATPREPSVLGAFPGVEPWAVQVVGSLSYVADGNGQFLVLDVSDPTDITQAASEAVAGAASLLVRGQRAYVGASSSVRIFDVSTPEAPASRDVMAVAGSATAVAATMDRAYLGAEGMFIFDVADATNTSQLSGPHGSAQTRDVIVRGRLAYVGQGGSIEVLDVSDSANVMTEFSYITADRPYDIDVTGDIMYVADDRGALQTIALSCTE